MPYEPIPKGEKKFVAVQPTKFTKDPAGNKPESGPDVFTGGNTKAVDRAKSRLGKGPNQKIDYEKAEVAAESVIDEGNKENKAKKNNQDFHIGFKMLQGVEKKRPDEKERGRTIRRNSSSAAIKHFIKTGMAYTDKDKNESVVTEITDREWEGSSEDKRCDKKNGFKDGTPEDKKADKKMVNAINKTEKTVKEDHSDIISLILDVKPLEVEEAFTEKMQELITSLVEEIKKDIAKSLFEGGGSQTASKQAPNVDKDAPVGDEPDEDDDGSAGPEPEDEDKTGPGSKGSSD